MSLFYPYYERIYWMLKKMSKIKNYWVFPFFHSFIKDAIEHACAVLPISQKKNYGEFLYNISVYYQNIKNFASGALEPVLDHHHTNFENSICSIF